MADDMEDVIDSGKAPKDATKKKGKLIIVGALALAVILYFNIRGNESDTPDGVPEKTTETVVEAQGPATSSTQDAPNKVSETSSIDIQKSDSKAFVIEFDKRLTEMAQNMNKIIDKTTTQETKIDLRLQGMENNIDKRLGEIVEAQTKAINDGMRDIRYGPGGTLPGGEIVSGPSGSALGERKTERSQIEYISFGAPMKPSDGGKPFSPITDAKEALKEGIGKTPETPLKPTRNKVPEKRQTMIPGTSYAHVTMLHAVDCPAINDKSVPVVLPIMGAIKGPNGDIVDLGQAHVLGMCVGMPNTSRGRILVQSLSYVATDQKPQFVKVEGYVVDRRDSGQDVKGILEENNGAALAKTAAASAIAALGGLAMAAQSTTTTNTVTGGSSSVVTGNIGKAATGAAISSAAERTAAYYQAQVEAIIPIVHVEAGLPLDLIFTAPFTVEDPAQEEDYALL